MTYRTLCATLMSLALVACSEPAPEAETSQDQTQINLTSFKEDVKTLASDEFLGRGPLTEGETLTIEYLAKRYQEMGIAGAVNGDYFQPVEIAQITPDPAMSLTIGDIRLTAGEQFTARTEQLQEQIQLNNSEVVFLGYGIDAPEYNWNDFAGVDVTGKTIIVLVNDPGYATQNDDLFTGNAMTYYGRWTYKYEEGARKGADAVFIVHETAPAAYPWSVVESSNTGSKYTLIDNEKNASRVPIMGWLDLASAEAIFAQAGLDYHSEKARALTPEFTPVALKSKANLTLNNSIHIAQSQNVVAEIKGSEKPNEYIVIGAHWDHFGSRETPEGLEIYNGAIDNAAGVAAKLEMARLLMAMHQQKPFKRSILFADFTAEETGLIGSEHLARGGIVDPAQMVALLNIDGMNVLEATDYVLQYGKDMSEMEDYLAAAAAAQGRVIKMDPRPENGLFFRSDHLSFAKQGVPSILFMNLGDSDPEYISHRYHKVSDDYSPDWPLAGVKQDIELMTAIAVELANNDDWPAWKADSDFKKRRAQDRSE